MNEARPTLSRPVAATAIVVLALGLVGGIAWQLSGSGNLTPRGEPVLPDFGIFYSAGCLALQGNAAAPYDAALLTAAFQSFFAIQPGSVSWNYPPPLLLAMMALAALPYLAAALLWGFGGLAGFVLALRSLAPGGAFLLAGLLFPGTVMALLSGQTALLVMAALGGGLALLDRRPAVAGMLLGLLVLKPNLAVLVPLALIAGRRWTPLAAAAGMAALLGAASVAVFGLEPWHGFFTNLRTIAAWDEAGVLRSWRMPSIYLQLKGLGLNSAAAMAAQAVTALGAAAAVTWAWRRPLPEPLQVAVLAAAVPLASPYVFEYDLVVLVLAILALWRDGFTRGWGRGEAGMVLLAWVAAVLPPSVSMALGVHPGGLFALLLLGLALRRALTIEPGR
jgi:hypothetical protein